LGLRPMVSCSLPTSASRLVSSI